MSEIVAGIRIPDSKLARDATDLLREHGTPLLFAHSLRADLFGAIQGRHRGWVLDHELFYVGAVFHDLGLTADRRQPAGGLSGAIRPRGFLPARRRPASCRCEPSVGSGRSRRAWGDTPRIRSVGRQATGAALEGIA
jgi:hypothetical protein